MHTLEVDGHHYSADHSAPRMFLLAQTAHAQKAKAAGRDPGLAQILILEFEGVLADQLAGIHRVVFGACSCGWVTDDVRQLGGHLDLRSVSVARTYVLTDDNEFGVGCQACRRVTMVGSQSEAETQRDQHHCEWAL